MKRIGLIMLVIVMISARMSYADTETINWYVDGGVYTTTTCQSGGDVNMPATNPTKAGYTFTGWLVALYDYSTLDYSVPGTGYTQNASARTWTTTFDYGVVSGRSLCSVTPGSYAVAGTPDMVTADGKYCWCMATGYKPVGSDIVYENSSSSPWVFFHDNGSASNCASSCADACGFYVRYYSAFRRAVFGAAGA